MRAMVAVEDLGQVVRRYLGRHTDGDALGTVYEQQRYACRQNLWLGQRFVIVWLKIDGLLFDIGEDLVGDLRQADLGVTHRGRIVAVDRAKISLPVDKRVTHREILRHTHDRVVNRRVAVRVIFTHDVADGAGRFLYGLL